MLTRLFHEEEGQTLVEYGLLVALIALVVVSILAILGKKIRDVYVNVNTGLKSTT